MKTIILMMRALCAAVLVVFSLVGCEEVEIYKINAPADLQARIDSIAAAKAAIDTGDTTYLDIATRIVGAEDNSSGWWSAFSDYFTVPTGKLLRLEFVNHSGAENWNNWNLVVANEVPDRDADDYAEYFVLRSDAYGWGNEDFDLGLVSHNYSDTDGDDDIWNDFRATMQGAYVTIEVDHSSIGYAYVTATAVGTNGTELEMTYSQPVSGTADITAFLVADASHFEMKNAYLLPSQITAIEDSEPTSIEITGTPALVEIGNENFWGNATATVTFADGSSVQVDSAELSFLVIPDMVTLGEKTVVVAYNKTKQGKYTQGVSSYYTLEVTNPVSSLEVTTPPDVTTYAYPGPATPMLRFDPTGMIVTATYSDGSTGVISNESLKFEMPSAEGSQEAVISYVGATNTVTTTIAITNVIGQIDQVGATDLSSGFWTAFSHEYNVASGSSRTFKMNLYSTGAENYHSPVVILRKGDLTEFAILRMDHFGWGDGYATATATSDWNWDTFTDNLNGSYIEITITNNGDNTADVRFDVTHANDETHFQLYEGITVDSSDLNSTITVEKSYVDITSVE